MPTSKYLYKFESDLEIIDPDCRREDWIRVGRAIYDATNESDYGLAIFNIWSSQGEKYQGIHEVRSIWRSFRTGEKDPYPVGTLATMAAETLGLDPDAYLQQEHLVRMRTRAPRTAFYKRTDENE